MSKREKAEIRFAQLLILLFTLTLASFWMLGNIYARYTVQVSDSDHARVAGFRITMEKARGTDSTGILLNKETTDEAAENISFTVSGKSEVTLTYKVQVELKHEDGTELTQEQWRKIIPTLKPQAGGVPQITGQPETLTDGKSAACTYTFATDETVSPGTDYKKDYTLDFRTSTLDKFTEGFSVKISIDGQQVD